MSSAGSPQLAQLSSAHPEWSPWLALIEPVIGAASDRRWEDCVAARPQRRDHAPLLAAATITVPSEVLHDWRKRLLRAAARAGTPALSTLGRAANSRLEPREWLRASLASDRAAIEALARDCHADVGALRSVAQLYPIPLLHACRRRWTTTENESWMQSYCPLCGAWPALAEVRGIERSRYLRCGRCGEQWPAYGLRCLFCHLDDHQQLVSLMSESAGPARTVDACKGCGGYLKSIATLSAGNPLHVLLDDLASVDLDIAAIDQGFHRPEGPGYRIDPVLHDGRNSGNSFFSWSR